MEVHTLLVISIIDILSVLNAFDIVYRNVRCSSVKKYFLLIMDPVFKIKVKNP